MWQLSICPQPVNKSSSGRIAPVSSVLASARRDPRLARRVPPPRPAPVVPPTQLAPNDAPIAPNVFDIKPLERVTKRKNVITIDVRPDAARDPRVDRARNRKRDERRQEREKDKQTNKDNKPDKEKNDDEKTPVDVYIDRLQIADPKKINKLPPIPKIQRDKEDPPVKKKRDVVRDKKKRERRDAKDSSSSSPEKRQKIKEKEKKVKTKERAEAEEKPAEPEVVAFKELKNYHKERYMRRNKEKSESPERTEKEDAKLAEESTSKISLFRMRG